MADPPGNHTHSPVWAGETVGGGGGSRDGCWVEGTARLDLMEGTEDRWIHERRCQEDHSSRNGVNAFLVSYVRSPSTCTVACRNPGGL